MAFKGFIKNCSDGFKDKSNNEEYLRVAEHADEGHPAADLDKAAITKVQAQIRRHLVQEQVRVRAEASGIIGVRVRKTGELAAPEGSPLGNIRSNLVPGTEYNHLRVKGGASRGGVFGPGTGERPKTVSQIARDADLPEGTAVINGGFFAHIPAIKSEEGWDPTNLPRVGDPFYKASMKDSQLRPVGEAGVGRPVGPTSTRTDELPIPSEYAGQYGQVNVGDQVGLSSGPVLAFEGKKTAIPTDDRFKYRVQTDEGRDLNPRNMQAGVMTHAGDKNARAAISVQGDDVLMHTATTPTMAPDSGATMAQWQAMTMAGAGIREGAENQTGSTLNLDGGGSVYMGIKESDGVRTVAKGQRAVETTERPVGNIIASQPDPEEEKR